LKEKAVFGLTICIIILAIGAFVLLVPIVRNGSLLTLAYDLTVRAIIIVALTDAAIFYVTSTKHVAITWELTFLVIVVTLVPLLINIWFVLWRYGVLKVS
jgi:hypothetical protein